MVDLRSIGGMNRSKKYYQSIGRYFCLLSYGAQSDKTNENNKTRSAPIQVFSPLVGFFSVYKANLESDIEP